ncbi:uncharacterized protein LOC144120465 [Amblyomma americanum]
MDKLLSPCLRSREVAGHASRLLPQLRAHDEEYYRDFLRMPPRTFDTLLDLVRSSITVEDTRFRSAIPAADFLVITIRHAKQVHDKLTHHFVTEVAVPWQNAMVTGDHKKLKVSPSTSLPDA